MPERGTILEVASGSGQHIACFAEKRPDLLWIPSDPKSEHRDSQRSWCQGLSAVGEPLDLDVCRADWALPEKVQAILAINLIHIAPWEACLGLLEGASRWLAPGGFLYLYGAYFQKDQIPVASNLAFDEGLRQQNPDWGVRHLEQVQQAALLRGFGEATVIAMPVNNLSVFFPLQ